MIIGFDAKRAFCNYTGLGNYSRTLIRALALAYPQHRYLLYTPGITDNPRLNFISTTSNIEVQAPESVIDRNLSSLWRSFRLGKRIVADNVDIYHGLSHELPVGISDLPFKKVVTIHDLIFLRYPRFYPWIDRQVYYRKIKAACQNADRIVAVSERTKTDLLEYFPKIVGLSNKTVVIYQTCDPQFAESAPKIKKEEIRRKYNLPAQYILNVGSIEARKNLLGLLEAYMTLSQQERLPLVVIGNGGAYKRRAIAYIKQHKLERKIQIIDNIPFADLPAIYQMAQLFVYPSFFEGFGIPILEALNSGVPVITSSGSCFREAGGDNTIYVTPGNREELTAAIKRALDDSDLRKRMIDGGKRHAAGFSEKIMADELMQLYCKLTL